MENPSRVHGAWIVLFACVAAVGWAADSYRHLDGTTVDECRVESYANGVFHIRIDDPAGGVAGVYEVPIGWVAELVFHPPGMGDQPGRPVELVWADGRVQDGAVAFSYRGDGETGEFEILPPDSPADTGHVSVPSGQVRSITFLEGAPSYNGAEPAPAARGDVPQPAPGGRADPAPGRPDAGDVRAGPEALEQDVATAVGNFVHGGGLLAVFAINLFGFLLQTLFLWYMARASGVPDFSLLKSAGTMILIAWVLPLVCLPLLCIPCIGWIAYLAGWLFGARAVIMGMMEVLESTAWWMIVGLVCFNVVAVLFATTVLDIPLSMLL